MTDEPAFPVPLTEKQLALLGEICAIQGQIETLMQETLERGLNIKIETAARALGHGGIRNNAEVWKALLLDGAIDDEFIDVVQKVHKAIETLAKGRNDFVHAEYKSAGVDLSVDDQGTISTEMASVAVRVKTRTTRDTSDLKLVRDEAARISRMMGHLLYLLQGHPSPSPWRGKF